MKMFEELTCGICKTIVKKDGIFIKEKCKCGFFDNCPHPMSSYKKEVKIYE